MITVFAVVVKIIRKNGYKKLELRRWKNEMEF